MRLVDHQHPSARREPGEDAIAEIGVVQALGADQQHVDLARVDRGVRALPVGGVGGVDRDGPDARALGRLDLVAHQREKRGHDHRGARAFRPQQRGGHEIHRRLAPPGALHDQRPPALRHEGVHGDPLVLAQARPGARQASERLLRLRAQVLLGGGHGSHRAPAVRQFPRRTGVVVLAPPSWRLCGHQNAGAVWLGRARRRAGCRPVARCRTGVVVLAPRSWRLCGHHDAGAAVPSRGRRAELCRTGPATPVVCACSPGGPAHPRPRTAPPAPTARRRPDGRRGAPHAQAR